MIGNIDIEIICDHPGCKARMVYPLYSIGQSLEDLYKDFSSETAVKAMESGDKYIEFHAENDKIYCHSCWDFYHRDREEEDRQELGEMKYRRRHD